MARKHAKHPTPGSSAPASSPGLAPTVDALIRQGGQAIDEYDYELARTTLTRAFELSGGAEVAAQALLVLLVDHLGADHEALALGDHASQEALASPGVRLALALAAARCGEHQRARGLLARMDGTPVADVLVVLAGAALASGDFAEATRLCDEARSQDAAHPGVQEMAHQIARAREESRRPLEAEVSRASTAGALDEARRLAEQLLTRFPESPVARRAVRAALEHELNSEAERLVRVAAEVSAQADPGALRAAYQAARAAVAAAPADEGRTLRLAAVEAILTARELAASVDLAVRRLTELDLRAGLLHYTALASDARRQVRVTIALPVLDDLEHLLGRRTDAREAVDALMALADAAANSDPEDALRQLAAHEPILGGLTKASLLFVQLRQHLADEQQRKLAELQAAARVALDRGDAAITLEILGKLPIRELHPAERDAALALRMGAQALLATQALESSYERLLQAGDPLAAREVAESLLARARDDERTSRQALVATAAEAARRAFGVWVSHPGDTDVAPAATSPIELGAPLYITSHQEDPLTWIDPDARSLVLIECCTRWLFLHVVDLESSRVRARAVVRTPEPLTHFSTDLSPDGVLTVAGGAGAVFSISLTTWDPSLWRSSAELAPGERVDGIEVAPGRRHAWIDSRTTDGATRIRVVDLERRRVVREVSSDWWCRPLAGADEPTMACSKRDTILSLHHPGGSPVDGGKFELYAKLRGAVIHPAEGRLLALVAEGEDDEGEGEKLGFVEIDRAGRVSAPRWLDDLDPTRVWACATSRHHQATIIVAHDDAGRPFLQTLRAKKFLPALEPSPRVPLPAFVLLARDPASRHVVALTPDHERLHVVQLGADAPEFPRDVPELGSMALPGLAYSGHCKRIGYEGATFYEKARELEHQPERSASAWMQRQIATSEQNLAKLVETHDILRFAGHAQIAADVLAWMREHLPRDPHAALLEAEIHAEARRWSDVRERLDGADLQGIILGRRQHGYHLLGLALAYAGEHVRAASVLAEGRNLAGECPLAELTRFVVPLGSSPDGDAQSPVHSLRAAIRDADACLVHDDLAGARAALDVRTVWQSEEVQALGRLAEVELQAEPDADLGKFRKALALARFLAAHRQFAGLRRDMPLPGTRWTAERIADVEKRAQAWLERLGAPEPHETPVLPTWSLALQELDEALDAMTAEGSPRATARLAFRVQHTGHKFDGLEPLLQRALRNGRFSAGQSTDAVAVLAALELLIDDADAPAVAALTDGVAATSRSRPSPSRARMHLLLGALVGHPRVFLADRPDEPITVQRGRLGVECVETPGGLVLHFLVGSTRWTAEELLHHADASLVIDIDADTRAITLAPLGPTARALATTLEHHHPVFPAESHDDLLRRLGALQHAIDIQLPDALAGERRPADSRLVVRLTPQDDVALLVEIGVYPFPGAGFAPPGEGAVAALGFIDELRVSARRDHW